MSSVRAADSTMLSPATAGAIAGLGEKVARQQRCGPFPRTSGRTLQAWGTCGVSIQLTLVRRDRAPPSARTRGGRSARSFSDTMQAVVPCATSAPARRKPLVHRPALIGLDVAERDPAQSRDRCETRRPPPRCRRTSCLGPVWNSSGCSARIRNWLKAGRTAAAIWATNADKRKTPSAILPVRTVMGDSSAQA